MNTKSCQHINLQTWHHQEFRDETLAVSDDKVGIMTTFGL